MDSALVIREIAHGSAEYKLEIDLRFRILREPLGLQFTSEYLEREKNDIHLGAFAGEELVGCLVLTRLTEDTVKLRQMAVNSSVQRQGIGGELIRHAEKKSRQVGYSQIDLNARETAVGFYERLGYEIQGGAIIEVSLRHRKMWKKLSSAD